MIKNKIYWRNYMSINFELYRFKKEVIHDLQNLPLSELKSKYKNNFDEYYLECNDFIPMRNFGTALFNFYDPNDSRVYDALYPKFTDNCDNPNAKFEEANREMFSRDKCQGLSDEEYNCRTKATADYEPIFFLKDDLVNVIDVYRLMLADIYKCLLTVPLKGDYNNRYIQKASGSNDISKMTDAQIQEKILYYRLKEHVTKKFNEYSSTMNTSGSPFNVNNIKPFDSDMTEYEGPIQMSEDTTEMRIHSLLHILHVMDWDKYDLVLLVT